MELLILLLKLLVEFDLMFLNSALEEYDVALEFDDDLFLVDEVLGDLVLEVFDEALLGIEFALELLVGGMELLVLDLDLVEELLDPHEVLHIILELQVLHRFQGVFHGH